MHDLPPHGWPTSPTHLPPSSPPVNGHESLMLGSLLGQLHAGQQRMIYLQEMVVTELRGLPDKIADVMPAPDAALPPPAAPLPPSPPEDDLKKALPSPKEAMFWVAVMAASIQAWRDPSSVLATIERLIMAAK